MNKKGFTLVELCIVVAIIGILAAVAIPQIVALKIKQQAEEAIKNGIDIATIESAEVRAAILKITEEKKEAIIAKAREEQAFEEAKAALNGLAAAGIGKVEQLTDKINASLEGVKVPGDETKAEGEYFKKNGYTKEDQARAAANAALAIQQVAKAEMDAKIAKVEADKAIAIARAEAEGRELARMGTGSVLPDFVCDDTDYGTSECTITLSSNGAAYRLKLRCVNDALSGNGYICEPY